MKNEKPNYLAPRMSELREMGYQPNDVSPESRQSLYDALVCIGSPVAKYAMWYLEHYGNFRQPALRAVTVLIYGLKHLPEFGNDLEGVANDMLYKVVREIMDKWKLNHKGVKVKIVRHNAMLVQRVRDMVCDVMDREAQDHIRRMMGKDVPEHWRSKRVVKHKGKARGGDGCYRIELYDRYYD